MISSLGITCKDSKVRADATTVEVRACPACRSGEYQSTGLEAPGFWEWAGDRQYEQLPYFVRECSSCGLLYRTRILPEEGFTDYYERVDFQNWAIDDLFPTERAALTQLAAIGPGARILDFGCSSGRLLAKLVATHACFGIELNAVAAAQAAEKGLTMLPVGILEVGYTEQFDAVVLVDVFEHLTEPFIVLRKLSALLRGGGLFLIVTGNGDSPMCRIDPAQFWYFRSVQHVSMLTKRHLTFLTGELGAKIESWQEISHYNTPLLERILQWGRHFVFWQFRNNTFLARACLVWLPIIRRARVWPVAPAVTCSRDHVVVVLRKQSID